ncbi:MAG: alpha/beta hydrolase [Anaerolineae bacterium]|nr:alpha/beta hydrolase [Anaerolineae bacterium]
MKRLCAGFIGLAAMGVVYGRYRHEKAQALLTLRAGSQRLNGVEFAMQGEGKPILILHGGFGAYEQGLATAELLGLDGQIIALSRPGYRRTGLGNGRTLSEQAQMACRLLDQLGIDSVYVLAISGGGLAALQLALNHPTRCAGLIMLSAHGPALLEKRPAAHWLWLMRLFMASDFPVWVAFKMGMWALIRLNGNQRQEGDFANFWSGFFPGIDWRVGMLNDLEQLLGLTGMPLENIRVPTLLIHGDRDTIVSYNVAVDMHGHIPHSHIVTIPGGTHLIVATHGPEIGRVVAQFIEEKGI